MQEIVRIGSRGEFHDAVRNALTEAAAAGWREIWLCDPDFADWPLNEAGLIDSLTGWAAAHRRLHLLALDYDQVLRRHPRFVRWRVQWAHVMVCGALQDLQPVGVPVLLHAPGALTLRLFDPLRHQGRVSRLPADIAQAGELVDAISQRSTPAFAATTLGL
jgi:hypothetical protein